MSSDKMRAEFEAWAKAVGHDLSQTKGDDRYWFVSTESAWESWQAGYQAGQKAEREAIFIEWENGELLASEVERLRAELAEAKAASVLPCAEESAIWLLAVAAKLEKDAKRLGLIR